LYRADELTALFQAHPSIEFLLDVAHIDDYDHLAALVSAKRPTMLHLADSHFAAVHEHLPLGEGEIDFASVFTQQLHGFEGTIIFEIIESDAHIVAAKSKLTTLFAHHTAARMSYRT
jgi:sugar phosphate isomerase/epimerase